MRWFKPNIRSSFYALLARVHLQTPQTTVLQYSTEGIRETMLTMVGDAGDNAFQHVARSVRYAIDVHALWYLRGDVMAALAARYGEAEARERLDVLTDMFEEFLPQGLRSRPSASNAPPKKE